MQLSSQQIIQRELGLFIFFMELSFNFFFGIHCVLVCTLRFIATNYLSMEMLWFVGVVDGLTATAHNILFCTSEHLHVSKFTYMISACFKIYLCVMYFQKHCINIVLCYSC